MYGRGYQTSGLGFGPPFTPTIVKQLLIANAVVFVAQMLTQRSGILEHLFAISTIQVWHQGFLWQPFTYMWLHASLGHIAMNMFALWMFGSQLAMVWGARRFLRFYLLCGVGAGIIISVFPYLALYTGFAPPQVLGIPTLGASGAIYGVLLAYSLTWPDRTIMLIFPPVAFRAIWLIPGLFLMAYMFPGGGNISHIGHLGGVLVAWLYLRRTGEGKGLFSLERLRWRWRRYRMRQKLRAVHLEDRGERRRSQDRTLH